MGKSERRALESHLSRLLLHLLKWHRQPERRGSSWANAMKSARIEIRNGLTDNPSLKPKLPELIARAYSLATVGAAEETGLEEATFPTSCPWSFDEVMESALSRPQDAA